MRRIAFVLLVLTLASGCDAIRDVTNPSGVQTQADGTGSGSVEYRVSGTAARASMTYAPGSGGTGQSNDRVLPWSLTTTGFVTGQFVYLSAQNQGATGCVAVEIRKRGSSYKTVQSCGAYAIATVDGSY